MMTRLASRTAPRRLKSFTLVELMISVGIMSILASAALFALYGVLEDAKEARTRSQIARLSEIVGERWDGYRSRVVPVQVPAGVTPKTAAQWRLAGIRELMRMELPDRKTDVIDSAITLRRPGSPTSLRVSLRENYLRRAKALVTAAVTPTPSPWYTGWTGEHQGAECLYLIVASSQRSGTNALDFFRESEIGDVDGDGVPEILDAWGNPIRLLRWAPGFLTNSDIQVKDSDVSPDPFDPLKVDPRWSPGDGDSTNDPYALFPLIFSAGRDGVYDIVYGNNTTPISYASPPTAPSGYPTNLVNDPYLWFDLGGTPSQFGQPSDDDNDGLDDGDNITNHLAGAN